MNMPMSPSKYCSICRKNFKWYNRVFIQSFGRTVLDLDGKPRTFWWQELKHYKCMSELDKQTLKESKKPKEEYDEDSTSNVVS